MNIRASISWLTETIKQELFPYLDECFTGPVTKKQHQLIAILEVIEIERFVVCLHRAGRRQTDRQPIAHAFVAKAVFAYATTRDLIESLHGSVNLRKICGFRQKRDIPSEATFSRAFSEFSVSDLGNTVHEVIVKQYLGGLLIGHVSRDSTAIEGHERPAKKEEHEVKQPARRGRPKKGEVRVKPETRIERQSKQSPADAIRELPVLCDTGCKRNAQGYVETWRGYKLHLDTADCGLPLNAVVTSASLHDSQVAIPLMKLTSGRVAYCYDMMDSAYDAQEIRRESLALGHVPIIDRNGRGGEVLPMSPAEVVRYRERSAAERTNSRLKGEFAGETVMVRGIAKVRLHLMIGVIALFADQLIKLAT